MEEPTTKNPIPITTSPFKNSVGERPIITIPRKIESRLANTRESTKDHLY
ncbi:MAG: hypothetical protein ACPLF9_05465 [Methanothermobacter tenebrarum]|nr:hypothetical protein [Methanobacteriales archaeon]NPV64088.1 hypothetical protein [Methanobacteriaceae archaeon]